MKITTLLFFALILFASGCSSSKLVTAWKSPGSITRPYKKIMIIGIVKDSAVAIRKQMETHLVDDLKTNGFNAVSALEEFGKGGLANLEQEETYIKLCDRGIDAIITVALLDRRKEKIYMPARVKYYSNLYYYNRIWNYNVIQADLISGKGGYEESTQYLWETILFDLQTLSPVYTIQTKSFDPSSLNTMAHEQGKMILANMLKKRILIPPSADTVPLKAF